MQRKLKRSHLLCLETDMQNTRTDCITDTADDVHKWAEKRNYTYCSKIYLNVMYKPDHFSFFTSYTLLVKSLGSVRWCKLSSKGKCIWIITISSSSNCSRIKLPSTNLFIHLTFSVISTLRNYIFVSTENTFIQYQCIRKCSQIGIVNGHWFVRQNQKLM